MGAEGSSHGLGAAEHGGDDGMFKADIISFNRKTQNDIDIPPIGDYLFTNQKSVLTSPILILENIIWIFKNFFEMRRECPIFLRPALCDDMRSALFCQNDRTSPDVRHR